MPGNVDKATAARLKEIDFIIMSVGKLQGWRCGNEGALL
jgi:hypothetical protein